MAKLPEAAQGTFDELLAGVEPKLAAIAKRLRAIIQAVDKGTVETVRLGDNAATYGVGPRKMSDGYAYISRCVATSISASIRALCWRTPNICWKAPARDCVT